MAEVRQRQDGLVWVRGYGPVTYTHLGRSLASASLRGLGRRTVEYVGSIAAKLLLVGGDGMGSKRGETIELVIEAEDLSLPATLTLPADGVNGGMVSLHGAGLPSRDSFIYEHLADALMNAGWATLRYDRRPSGEMVPLRPQVQDALTALEVLRFRPELSDAPTGFWGLSQGAWTAMLAAAQSDAVDLLVLVGFSGVSPGRQMRYATANFLRQDGFGSDRDLEELAELRSTYERYLRGDQDRTSAQGLVDELRARPWFRLAYVDATLPDRSALDDPHFFEFEPEGHLVDVKCPVLAFYGDQDDNVPVADSIAVLKRSARRVGNEVSVQVLEGVGHYLTVDDRDEADALHPDYQPHLVHWLAQHANRKHSAPAGSSVGEQPANTVDRQEVVDGDSGAQHHRSD